MTAAELERKLKLLINEEGIAAIVETLGDICGDKGDDDAQFYLWNAAEWLRTKAKSPLPKFNIKKLLPARMRAFGNLTATDGDDNETNSKKIRTMAARERHLLLANYRHDDKRSLRIRSLC